MMKRLFSFFAMAAVVLGMASCNGNDPELPTPIGAIKGKFSVAPGKQVYFSRGNLQYNAFHDKWRFAENQWDFVGNAEKGTVKIGVTKCDNSQISPSYNGWIDCFGWGTGLNPTNTSTTDVDYQTFTDWGNNPISNGGNQAYLWRTLTNDEWNYLFRGRANGEKLFGGCTINGDNGVIILPDDWNLLNDTNFTASTDKGLLWNEDKGYYENTKKDNFTHNTYTIEEWQKLEANGAVFLPGAGDRAGIDVIWMGYGFYWSSTLQASSTNTKQAYGLCLGKEVMEVPGIRQRHYGFNVRLVQDVK